MLLVAVCCMRRALSKLTFGLQAEDLDKEDELDEDLDKVTSGEMRAIAMESSMTMVDFSKKNIGAADAMLIAAFLPKCQ